jgi:hypothetical protein
MSENKLKENPREEEEKEEKIPRKKSNGSRNIIRFINVFGHVNRNQVVHSMPFILFISLLLIIYIGNNYYAEGLIRDIDRTKKELKEKRAEYISTKSRLMYHSNQSEMAKALEPFQVKESVHPPGKIFIAEEKRK